MSDLSSNDILDTFDHTNAHDANRVDSTPEDWESIIDFEMKNSKEDSSLKESNENQCSLNNRPQAEQDSLDKNDNSMNIEDETDLSATSTEAAPDESNNAMEIDATSNEELGNEDKNLDTTLAPNNEAPASASDLPETTGPPVSISVQMFQRLLQKGVIANDQQLNRPKSMVESYRPLEEILMNFDETDKASIGMFNNLVYLPPYLVEKYLAPTAEATRQINDLANRLFSERDAILIKSLFAQASLTNPSTQETAVKNITEQPLSNTVAATVTDLRDVMRSKETALQKYVEQLRKAAELPDEQTIIAMADEELTLRNQRLDQLFTNFEEQIKKDYLIL
jgi:hypothetical protein